MKKVLIFYATYGGGHLSAAKSIKQYIDENYTDVQTEMIDCVKCVNKVFDKITTDAYKEMAKKAPWMWKTVYDNAQDGLLSKLSNDANKMMSIKMNKIFKEIKPDIVISTHPFGSQMTTILKKKGKINCPLATVMTDFAPHDQWLVNSEYVDYFFVSNEDMKKSIIENNNIDKNKVFVTGIPVSKKFLQSFNAEEIYSEFELSKNMKTVLFFGGGEYGLGKEKTVNILKCLAKYDNIQVIAIAGKNQKLKKAFEKVVEESNKEKTIKVLPFTDKVPQLMYISNLVITKPGGLTISESLVSGLPIIVINPIPGQEEENANFLENAGCAVWIRKKSNPAEIIDSILLDDKKLRKMKINSVKISRKNATENICKICLNGEE